MTLLDFLKLNVYLAMKYFSNKDICKSFFMALNLEVLFLNAIIITVLGLFFIPNMLLSYYYGEPLSTGVNEVSDTKDSLKWPLILKNEPDIENNNEDEADYEDDEHENVIDIDKGDVSLRKVSEVSNS